MAYVVAWWLGVHLNTVEGLPLGERGGRVIWSCCKLDDVTHSPYCHSFHSVFICTVLDLGHLRMVPVYGW